MKKLFVFLFLLKGKVLSIHANIFILIVLAVFISSACTVNWNRIYNLKFILCIRHCLVLYTWDFKNVAIYYFPCLDKIDHTWARITSTAPEVIFHSPFVFHSLMCRGLLFLVFKVTRDYIVCVSILYGLQILIGWGSESYIVSVTWNITHA